EDADPPALGQTFHAPPQEVVCQVFRRRGLEGVDLAALRVDAGHDVLDGTVLAGRVHRLEDEQHRPAVVGVEDVLQLGQRLDAGPQRFRGARLVLVAQLARVAGREVLEAELGAHGDTVRLGQGASEVYQFANLHVFSALSLPQRTNPQGDLRRPAQLTNLRVE